MNEIKEQEEFAKYEDYEINTAEDIMKLWDRFVVEENIINSDKIRGWLQKVVNELTSKGDGSNE